MHAPFHMVRAADSPQLGYSPAGVGWAERDCRGTVGHRGRDRAGNEGALGWQGPSASSSLGGQAAAAH